MKKLIALLLLSLATSVYAAGPFSVGGPATTDNDDSCDISLLPAATLLLPYFEVDVNAPAGSGETTIFTVTNVTNLPQIAHVTLWTDYGYPIIDFNIYLTGYDVQSVNLFDVIRRGQIAPDKGTGFDVSPVGKLSGDAVTDVELNNPLVDEQSCTRLPVQIPSVYIERMLSAFTRGRIPALGSQPACNTLGGPHKNAVGYATIDVVASCATVLPTELAYYSGQILFDNVLSGDYLQVNGTENYAQGSPMVHIRATPEGGTARERASDADYRVNLPRTFYSRFQHSLEPRRDARQPLPSTFAARWISGGGTNFETFYKIWRESGSTAATACSAYPVNSVRQIAEIVRFDEEENPETRVPNLHGVPVMNPSALPSAALVNVNDGEVFPHTTEGAVGGWMYLNLDVPTSDGIATQSWVVSSMRADDRFSVDIDALALGNGCSAPIAPTEAVNGSGSIGPSPNVRP